MPKITNFVDAQKLLSQFVPRAKQTGGYSLDRMLELMDKLGNPQNSYKVIHVAGTSGKTSTCYYTTALLQAAGQKVGLTVSPHVDQVNERVQINLKPLDEKLFCRELSSFLNSIEGYNIKPTYFEVLVAFAYWYFAKAQVDYAVVEVGLGGLLDGTNVIKRQDKVCVITDIGLDHTEILGKTLPEIANQKAGIIQSHNIVFMYRQANEVMQVVTEKAKQQKAQLYQINNKSNEDLEDLPPFQKRNFGLAKVVYEFVAKRDNLPTLTPAILLKSAHTKVPARMETFTVGNKTVIVDGSHNGQKMIAITEGVSKLYTGKQVAALVSFVDSEEGRAEGALKVLRSATNNLIITAFSGEQDTPNHSVNPEKIAGIARSEGFTNVQIINDPKAAFEVLLKQTEPVLLVTGSFYLLNHIRPLILKS